MLLLIAVLNAPEKLDSDPGRLRGVGSAGGHGDQLPKAGAFGPPDVLRSRARRKAFELGDDQSARAEMPRNLPEISDPADDLPPHDADAGNSGY